jgi:hypothetical protein
MSYATLEEKQAISRYFAPEKRIPQLLKEIEQLQKGGGAGIRTVANIGGNGVKGVFDGIGWVTSFGGKETATLTSGFKLAGGLLNTLIKAGGKAADDAARNEAIKSKAEEIVKIQSGNMSRGISEEYLDAIVENLVPDNLYKRALDELMLDESQVRNVKPVCLEDYFIDETDENQIIARGKDGIDRSPIYQVTWLLGTDKQLCVYQYTINLETGENREITKKYFWKNITELSNSTEIVRGNRKKYFVIKVANGDYKFAYKGSDEVKRSIRGLNAFYDINN